MAVVALVVVVVAQPLPTPRGLLIQPGIRSCSVPNLDPVEGVVEVEVQVAAEQGEPKDLPVPRNLYQAPLRLVALPLVALRVVALRAVVEQEQVRCEGKIGLLRMSLIKYSIGA